MSMTELKVAKAILGLFLLGAAALLVYATITDPVGMLIFAGVVVAFFGLMWSAVIFGEHLNDRED